LGHLTQIANKINDSKSDIVLKHTSQHSHWKIFVETELKATNDRNAINLGGKDPRARNSEDEEMNQEPEVKLELPGIMQKFTRFFGNKR